MTDVAGSTNPAFEAVRDRFEAMVATGEEPGASVFVDVDGKPVVDLWGGHRDPARLTPWTEDTVTNVWSSTKTVTNLAVLILVERGLVDLDAPVATYWPEFAANGKAGILVRHIMGHTSGVSGWEAPFDTADLYDWDSSTARLAAQSPWWEPGTASGYHALAQGHLLGELVRRVTGRGLRQFVAEDIAGPLGADFQIGLRPSDEHRVADIVGPTSVAIDLAALDPDSPTRKTFHGLPADVATTVNSRGWRGADMGALNGHTTARGLGRILSAITLGGTVDGVRLLSAHTLERIFDVQADGVDLVLGVPLRWGTGYALPQPLSFPFVPEGRVCFWGGWGGSLAVMDLDRRLTFTYVMNTMAPDIIGNPRSVGCLTAAYAALGVGRQTAGQG